MPNDREEDLLERIRELRGTMTEDNETEVMAEIEQLEDELTGD
jgi:hypothetical protein|tara:strand:- start:919 stop:1047 length:129 start_codon:yes stop_codon:yes gene_type:complete